MAPDFGFDRPFVWPQDPTEVISKYGADALRLYLINSPVVRADNLNFQVQFYVN